MPIGMSRSAMPWRLKRPLESIHDFIDCVKAGKYSLVLDMKLER